MMLAKAPQITILLPLPDQKGTLRFPTSGDAYFGINVRLEHGQPVSQQAVAAVERFFGRDDLASSLKVLAVIEPVLREAKQDPSLLYLMRPVKDFMQAPDDWLRIIDVLRELPPGSNRVAYNKALQYFAGAADQELDILEVDGEVKQRLQELMGEGPQSC